MTFVFIEDLNVILTAGKKLAIQLRSSEKINVILTAGKNLAVALSANHRRCVLFKGRAERHSADSEFPWGTTLTPICCVNARFTKIPIDYLAVPCYSLATNVREEKPMRTHSHQSFFSFYYFYAGRTEDWLLRVE